MPQQKQASRLVVIQGLAQDIDLIHVYEKMDAADALAFLRQTGSQTHQGRKFTS